MGVRGGLLVKSGSGRRDGAGGGVCGGGGGVWEEEGEVFLSSRRFPREPLEHSAGDNRQTGRTAPAFLSLSPSLAGITRVSVRCYLFNGTRSTDLAAAGKLVSLLTAT